MPIRGSFFYLSFWSFKEKYIFVQKKDFSYVSQHKLDYNYKLVNPSPRWIDDQKICIDLQNNLQILDQERLFWMYESLPCQIQIELSLDETKQKHFRLDSRLLSKWIPKKCILPGQPSIYILYFPGLKYISIRLNQYLMICAKTFAAFIRVSRTDFDQNRSLKIQSHWHRVRSTLAIMCLNKSHLLVSTMNANYMSSS